MKVLWGYLSSKTLQLLSLHTGERFSAEERHSAFAPGGKAFQFWRAAARLPSLLYIPGVLHSKRTGSANFIYFLTRVGRGNPRSMCAYVYVHMCVCGMCVCVYSCMCACVKTCIHTQPMNNMHAYHTLFAALGRSSLLDQDVNNRSMCGCTRVRKRFDTQVQLCSFQKDSPPLRLQWQSIICISGSARAIYSYTQTNARVGTCAGTHKHTYVHGRT